MWSTLSNKRENISAKVIINISFIIFSYMLISLKYDVYYFKKTLTLYFIVSLITLLITSNNILRTKFYLGIGALGLSLIQISEYTYFANILDKDFCLVFAFSSIACVGPFRLAKSENCEKFLNFISITSPFLLFYIFEKLINNYQVLLGYYIISVISAIYISVMRQQKITAIALAEIYSAYLIILHAQHLIPQERTYDFLLFFMFMTFSYAYLQISNLEEKYKKTMNYVMALLPLLVNTGFYEYLTVSVILFNLILSPFFYSLRELVNLDLSFLAESYQKFENYRPFENVKIEIKEFPQLRLSITFSMFFGFLFIFFYLIF